MMLLGREELERAIYEEEDLDHRLIITPLLERAQIGRGAVDLRLGTEFLLLHRTRHPGLDPGVDSQQDVDEMQERMVVPFGEKLWLHPAHFVLAATLEFLRFPEDMGAYVVGRSSWGRVGLIVATAVFVHPGFRGCLTLELVNEGDSPIALSPGLRIAQLAIHRLEEPAPEREGEEEKYVAPVRPQPSRLASEQSDFDRLASLGEALRSRLG
ncbi:MAG: dCTP deaminase [Actinobacteria bacterium]|nr:dCTP deaminase [Actinomycetota bacterium]